MQLLKLLHAKVLDALLPFQLHIPFIAVAPSCVADMLEIDPPIAPIGVLTALTTTALRPFGISGPLILAPKGRREKCRSKEEF